MPIQPDPGPDAANATEVEPVTSSTNRTISPDEDAKPKQHLPDISAILDQGRWQTICLADIESVHSAVPLECINSYPTIKDQPRAFGPTAVKWILTHHPIGVVEIAKAKYKVVTGLATWRILVAQRPVSSAKGTTQKTAAGPRTKTIRAFVYPPTLTPEDVSDLAAIDVWLTLTALSPDPEFQARTFVAANVRLDPALTRELTPNLISIRGVARFLGHRSHTRLSINNPKRTGKVPHTEPAVSAADAGQESPS